MNVCRSAVNSELVDYKSKPVELDFYLDKCSYFLHKKIVNYARKHYESLLNTVISIVVYSDLNEDEASEMVCIRDLINIAQNRASTTLNMELLGCETSLANQVKSGKRSKQAWHALEPGNQISIEMKLSILNQNGDPVKVNEVEQKCVILSIPGPALDNHNEQPEFKIYVDRNGHLLTELYRKSMNTIMKHIKCSTANNPNQSQVVLTAVGMGNFLNGLNFEARKMAIEIGVKEFARLVVELRCLHRNKREFSVNVADLQNSPGRATGPFWSKVDQELALLRTTVSIDMKNYCESVHCVGKLPGDWISNKSLIINAWDPHSLVGNGCNMDRSIDGDIGKHFAVHPAHFLLIHFRSKGLKLFKNKACN